MIREIYTAEFLEKFIRKDKFIAFFLSYAQLSSDMLRKSVEILDKQYNNVEYCCIDISYAYEFGHLIPFDVQYTPQILFCPPPNPAKRLLGNLPVEYLLEIMEDEGFLVGIKKKTIRYSFTTEY
jgi:hypothetical protein